VSACIGLFRGVMWRRAISCMLSGVMIALPFYVLQDNPPPHKLIILTTIVMCVAGIMWLYDEIKEILAARPKAYSQGPVDSFLSEAAKRASFPPSARLRAPDHKATDL